MPIQPPTIYLAASSKDLHRVKQIVAKLNERGANVRLRWWDMPNLGKDRSLALDEQRFISRRCYSEIKAADVFWLLFPREELPPSQCLLEAGYAIYHREQLAARALEPFPIIVTGRDAHNAALTSEVDFRDTDDWCGLHEAMRHLQAIASARLSQAEVV